MRIVDTLSWEPSERWVRGLKNGVTVVDSKHPLLVLEPGLPYPAYAFPKKEVRTELLRPSTAPPEGKHAGSAIYYDLVVAEDVISNAAWTYPAPELSGHIAFEWFRHPVTVLDHWYEESEEIFVLPRDPYHRVDALRSSRQVQVLVDGRTVAESSRPVLVFETGMPVRYYLPAEDVDMGLFEPTATKTGCPYKGTASYWAYVGEGGRRENVAWAYRTPIAAVSQIKDHLAFYDEAVEIVVDGVKI